MTEELTPKFKAKRQQLVNSLLKFTQIFYFLRTGRKFDLGSKPIGFSHFELIISKLEDVFDGKIKRLIINIPPRFGKTELAIHFIAWAMAQYPDSAHMYISYSHTLAKKQTQTIREIMQMKEYRDFFSVQLKEGAIEKSNFETEQSGVIFGVGAQGGITGRGAGLKGVNRYGGCIFIDDIIKPEDALSDTVRESTNEWFYNTLQSRVNGPDTPIVVIGQRTHEEDLCAKLIKMGGWEVLSLPALDAANNALYPEMLDAHALLKMKDESPWVFVAQYQQNPVAGGAALFKPEWFPKLDFDPQIITTFITCDTAQSDKDYADATVFSFFGIYKMQIRGVDIPEVYGLHWIDCWEMRIEPKDLHPTFLDFYASCMRYKVKPSMAAIEKKSTGVTLLSVLKGFQGLRIIEIERTRASGSKTARFLEIQPFIARNLITFPVFGEHTPMCIKHMGKITINNAHRFDDIADTLYDGIKLALIDKTVINSTVSPIDYGSIAKNIFSDSKRRDEIKLKAYRG